MGSKLVCLLFASVLAALMLAAEGDHDTPQQLLYPDVLQVLSELSAPYNAIVALRNVQTNQQVDSIISQVQSITPAMATLHQLVHNISSNVSRLISISHLPILRVKDTLKDVIGHLSTCYRTPSIRQQTSHTQYETATIRHHTPSTSGSSESSSSSSSEEEEEGHEHHQSPLAPTKHDARALRHTADHSGPHFLDVLHGVTSDDSRLDAILNRYDTNSVVSLNDTARAFQAMADQFDQYQQSRFINLMSRIREVKDTMDNFNHHVAHTASEVTTINDLAITFYSASLICVDELTNLILAVRDFTDRIC